MIGLTQLNVDLPHLFPTAIISGVSELLHFQSEDLHGLHIEFVCSHCLRAPAETERVSVSLDRMGCAGLDYRQQAQQKELRTGGMSVSTQVIPDSTQLDMYEQVGTSL